MLNVIGDMQDYRVASHSGNNFEKVSFFFPFPSLSSLCRWSHLGRTRLYPMHIACGLAARREVRSATVPVRYSCQHVSLTDWQFLHTHTSCRTHSIPFSGTLGERCNAIFASLRSLCFGSDGTKQHGKIKHLVSLCRRDGWTYLGPRFAADKAAPSKPEQAGERLSTCPPAYVHHITVARAHAAAASV